MDRENNLNKKGMYRSTYTYLACIIVQFMCYSTHKTENTVQMVHIQCQTEKIPQKHLDISNASHNYKVTVKEHCISSYIVSTTHACKQSHYCVIVDCHI